MALGDIRLRYHRTCSSQAVSMTWKWRLCPSSAEYQTNPSRWKSWTPKMMSQRGRVAEPEKFGYTQRDASGPSRRMPPGLWDRMDGTFLKGCVSAFALGFFGFSIWSSFLAICWENLSFACPLRFWLWLLWLLAFGRWASPGFWFLVHVAFASYMHFCWNHVWYCSLHGPFHKMHSV